MSAPIMASTYAARRAAILHRVRGVPEGWVRTYGDCSPGAPRLTGAVLSATDEPDLPWHRIVRADGSLAKGARQRALLEEGTAGGTPVVCGVPFRGGRVDSTTGLWPAVPGTARLPD